MKKEYDRVIRTYHQYKETVGELHIKASNLKKNGLKGELIESALRNRVDPILERRIPNEYR